MPPLKLRWEVRDFAEHMERKLRQNDYKTYWRECDFSYLKERLYEEVEELRLAIDANGDIQDEAVDVANLAMMVFDLAPHGAAQGGD